MTDMVLRFKHIFKLKFRQKDDTLWYKAHSEKRHRIYFPLRIIKMTAGSM